MRIFLTLLVLFALAGPLCADPISGPGRTTLLREQWGSVFLNPSQIEGDYEVSVNEDATVHTVVTGQGSVVINETIDDLTLQFPNFKGEVLAEHDRIVIDWGSEQHVFSRAGNVMTYQGPRAKVTFTKTENSLLVEGPRGTVQVTEADGAYTVESPAGKTEYVTTPRGFKVSGVRLTEHPYLRRGAVFSHGGVGVYVELALLDPRNPLFKLLDWDTIVEIGTEGTSRAD